jgi:hypothetical protein
MSKKDQSVDGDEVPAIRLYNADVGMAELGDGDEPFGHVLTTFGRTVSRTILSLPRLLVARDESR